MYTTHRAHVRASVGSSNEDETHKVDGIDHSWNQRFSSAFRLRSSLKVDLEMYCLLPRESGLQGCQWQGDDERIFLSALVTW